VFFQAEVGIRDFHVTGVQTSALPICTSSTGSAFIAATSRASSGATPVGTPASYTFTPPITSDASRGSNETPAFPAAVTIRPQYEIGRASCRVREYICDVAQTKEKKKE